MLKHILWFPLQVSFEIPIADIYVATSIFISPTLIRLTISQNGELNLGHIIKEFVPDNHLIVTVNEIDTLKFWPPFLPNPLAIALLYSHVEVSKAAGSWAVTMMNMKLKMTQPIVLFGDKIHINNLELDLNYEKGKDSAFYGAILGQVALGVEENPRVDIRIPFPFKHEKITFKFTNFSVRSVVEALAGSDLFSEDFPEILEHIQLDQIAIAFDMTGQVKTVSVDASIQGLWHIFGQFSIGDVTVHFEYGKLSGDGTGDPPVIPSDTGTGSGTGTGSSSGAGGGVGTGSSSGTGGSSGTGSSSGTGGGAIPSSSRLSRRAGVPRPNTSGRRDPDSDIVLSNIGGGNWGSKGRRAGIPNARNLNAASGGDGDSKGRRAGIPNARSSNAASDGGDVDSSDGGGVDSSDGGGVDSSDGGGVDSSDGDSTPESPSTQSSYTKKWILKVRGKIVIGTCTIRIEADLGSDVVSISADSARCSVSVADILEMIHLNGLNLPPMISGFAIFNPKLRILWQKEKESTESAPAKPEVKSVAFAAKTSLFHESEVCLTERCPR